MRNCVICNTPIEGRSDKESCGNACRIKRHRLRAMAKDRFADVLYSLKNKDNVAQLIKDLEQLVEDINTDLSPTT
ncbi:hypothetical protein [Stutzerimonas kunmingensis]|uniref:hypothetical protein n=1 Tax=Stutzerimonas kunmingensis TaxID=1211807 RepID=UPI0028A9A773|nr:hypothetical protein [Stutzerimonas kunmingensis]